MALALEAGLEQAVVTGQGGGGRAGENWAALIMHGPPATPAEQHPHLALQATLDLTLYATFVPSEALDGQLPLD